MARLAASLCLMCMGALLAACADKPLAPIEDRGGPGTSKVEQRYTVLPGDTLFSIAFRYGLDFQRLAAANAIPVPYTIFAGQLLRLSEADPPRVTKSSPRAAPQGAPSAVAKAADKQAVNTTSSSQSKARVKTPGAAPTVSVQSPDSTSKSAIPVTNSKVAAWRWPVRGKVTRRFETNLHKGVDISGKRGDTVLATSGGSIVYAGSGIAGYGLMLIVRHNDEYLSAYGHNDALFVDEGDVVRAGQKIAERGSSGTDSVKLHFEIRRRGRPVDPLQLLPAR